MSAATDRLGLLKLMLKMPALRGQLQVFSARDAGLLSLCGAFGDASDTLERLRLADPEKNREIILEYEKLCAEIEEDVIQACLSKNAVRNQ